jgi:hypothetical protein
MMFSNNLVVYHIESGVSRLSPFPLGSTFSVAWINTRPFVHQTGGRRIQRKMTSSSLPDLGSASSLNLDKK